MFVKFMEINENNAMIFELLYKKKYDKLIKELTEYPKLDLNITDTHNNYFISYVLLSGNTELLKKVLEFNIRLDIIDNDGYSLLYMPIKYNNIDIVELLINYITVGIPICDVKDIKNKNIPLMYSLEFNNITMFNLLIDKTTDIFAPNKQGLNILHLCIKHNQLDSFKLLIKKLKNKNLLTSNGESYLHYAINSQNFIISKLLIKLGIDVNIMDSEYNFTPLHYVCSNGNLKIAVLLLEQKNIEINIQDIFGNTPLHQCIDNDNFQIYQLLIQNPKLNYNLYNFNGNYSLHLLLSKYKKYNKYNIENLIEKTNLNFQNNAGNSCFHYIVMEQLWKQYKHILLHKKLNILVINKLNKTVLDYVDYNDKDEFIDLLTHSYLNILHNNTTTEYQYDWENICKKDGLLNLLSVKELKTLEKYYKSKNNDEKISDRCNIIIKNHINSLIKHSSSEQKKCQYSMIKTYPSKKKQNKCMITFENFNTPFCTFTGDIIDIFFGNLVLLNLFDFVGTAIDIISTKNESKNYGITDGEKTIDYEILWREYYENNKQIFKLHTPENLVKSFMLFFKNTKKRFFYLFIGIELKIDNEFQGHSNCIIFDKNTNQLERFEPKGSSIPINFNYHPEQLDKELYELFLPLSPELKYFKPSSYIPKISFQSFESSENISYIGDPSGFCSLWTIWYIYMRMKYKDYSREKLVKYLINTVKQNNIYFKDIVRSFSKIVIDFRDKIFSKIGIDINVWRNEQTNTDQIKKLFDIIIANIN